MQDFVPATMHAEMHDIQPLMHLLSTYVIKPIAFDANPYVLPRAAQFVKYGGANKYFQKHKQPYSKDQAGEEGVQGGAAEIRRPKTAAAHEKQDEIASVVDDFETVGEKQKKPAKLTFKKQLADTQAQSTTQLKPDSRKTSDVNPANSSSRKTSDVSAVAA